MKNKSVHNCQFVHHANFHCIMTTLNKVSKMNLKGGGLEKSRKINSSSVRKNHQYPAFQIRWFLVECLGKMQFCTFPSFSAMRLQACLLLVKRLMSPSSVQLTLEGSVVLWQNASSCRGSLSVY